jgi:signal transduction histidine kinase/CheY-like chemotaxis protein
MDSGNIYPHASRSVRPRLLTLAALPLFPAAPVIYAWMFHETETFRDAGLAVLSSALLALFLALVLARGISQRVVHAHDGAEQREQTASEGAVSEARAEEHGISLEQQLHRLREECETARTMIAERERLVADLAHEVRAPASAVLGYLELMRETGLQPGQLHHAEVIERASHQMLALLDDMLTRARTDAADARIDNDTRAEESRIEPGALVKDAVAMLAVEAGKRGLRLEQSVDAAVPARLRGNPLHFRQVLLNLIGNAIRFTSQGSVSVTVAMRPVAGTANEQIEVRVSDTGIGIEDGARAHIFEPFRQADASISTRYGGTGLGLAIVRRLVQSWGGSVGVDSLPGQGSTFWFTHPLEMREDDAQVPAREHGAATPGDRALTSLPGSIRERKSDATDSSSGIEGLRILVAEDNAFSRELLTHILINAGARVTPTISATAMLQQALAHDHDLAILDLRLPDMNGDEAARRLRQISRRRFPIMILSADVSSASLDNSAVDVRLSKPVSADRLLAIIRKVLRKECIVRPPSSAVAAPAHLKPQLTRSLLEFRARIAAATSGKDDELAAIAHELRGVAGYFGLQELADAAADSELLNRGNGPAEAVSCALLRLDACIEAALAGDDHATRARHGALQ